MTATTRVAIPAALLAALFAGAIGFEAVRTPEQPRFQPGVSCLLVAHSRDFDQAGPSTGFLTDGDRAALRGRPTFWFVSRRGRSGTAHRLELLADSMRRTAFPVRLPATGSVAFDVGTWASASPVLFVLGQTRTGVSVAVQSLGPGSRTLAAGRASAPRAGYEVRELAIARAGGRRPDLFVIDRHMRSGATRVSVYSGESRFRIRIAQRRIDAALEPRSWSFDVARTDAGRANLILIRRAAGAPTGRPEVHVLSGRSGFETFDLHLILSAHVSGMRQARMGPSLAGPSLYSFTPFPTGRERVSVTPITAAVFDPEC